MFKIIFNSNYVDQPQCRIFSHGARKLSHVIHNQFKNSNFEVVDAFSLRYRCVSANYFKLFSDQVGWHQIVNRGLSFLAKSTRLEIYTAHECDLVSTPCTKLIYPINQLKRRIKIISRK